MSDWRSKPRTGKAQFLKHLAVILTRLKAGETQNAIRQDLKQEMGLEISKAQFSRYVNVFYQAPTPHRLPIPDSALSASKTFNAVKNNQHFDPAPVAKSELEPPAPNINKAMTPSDLRKIRDDTDKLDLRELSKPVKRK